MTEAYSNCGLTMALYARSLVLTEEALRFLLIIARVLFPLTFLQCASSDLDQIVMSILNIYSDPPLLRDNYLDSTEWVTPDYVMLK